MSEYKIVNRVHPTPAFAQTMAEVEAQVELEKAIPLVKEVIQNPGVLAEFTKQNYEPSAAGVEAMLQKQFGPGSEHCCGNELAEGMKTAEASRATFVGQVGSLESWGEKVVRPFLERPIRREEFDDFKERVIRAFKDMGFDTRKFFDE